MVSHDMQLKYIAREKTKMTKERVSWETYFMNIAKEVSTRSTCDRKHVRQCGGHLKTCGPGQTSEITAKVDIFGHFWTFLYHGLVEMSTLAVISDVNFRPHVGARVQSRLSRYNTYKQVCTGRKPLFVLYTV